MKEEMSLHEWIYNYIEEAIRFGIFRQGEKLYRLRNLQMAD